MLMLGLIAVTFWYSYNRSKQVLSTEVEYVI